MIRRIISGGQTGVDRAALDVALQLGVPCGGWCPRDRWAEDGPIHTRYPLRQCAEADISVRTRMNVEDSDGTLIIAPEPLSGGTAQTKIFADELGRPYLTIDPDDNAPLSIQRWIDTNNIGVLNIAGPRASEWSGAYEATSIIILQVLAGSD
jgi:hypothetical protein